MFLSFLNKSFRFQRRGGIPINIFNIDRFS